MGVIDIARFAPDDTLAPGVRFDLDEATYHRSPGLSYSAAKVLLDCPRRYRYERDHPRQPTDAMKMGTCLHTEVFGAGQGWTVIEGDGRTKAVKDAKREAEEQGLIVLNSSDGDTVRGMANAVREALGAVLEHGQPEVSLSWVDEETGVPLRARCDLLHDDAIFDLKSCQKASPQAISKTIADYEYHIQHAAYTEGVAALDLGERDLWFIFVESKAPFIVTPVYLGPRARAIGAEKWRQAIRLYDACTRANRWPAYADDLIEVDLPAYVR